jgi:hypothetical protein
MLLKLIRLLAMGAIARGGSKFYLRLAWSSQVNRNSAHLCRAWVFPLRYAH